MTAAPKTGLPLRFLPSLTDVAFVMPILFLFLQMEGAKSMLGDGDTGWHVRTGEWILTHGRVPDRDIFSYTKAGEPWFAWEWLWDLAFGWLHRSWGMAAVVLGSVLVLSLTSALLFRLVRRSCANPFLAIAVTIIATAGSAIHWLARPHLFTLLFVVICCWILDSGKPRSLALLPLLTAIWTNLHGGFFIALILIAAYGAGEFVAALLTTDAVDRRLCIHRGKILLLAWAGSFLATFLNPFGYRLHVHIWQFLSGSFHLRFINEYQSLNFQTPVALYFEPMFFLGMLAAGWSIYRRRFAHAILLAGWAHLALFSARNLPVFMIISAPLVAGFLDHLLKAAQGARLPERLRNALMRFDRAAAEFASIDRAGRVHAASAVTVMILAVLLYAPAAPAAFRAEYDPKKYPAKALSVLDPRQSAHVFTHDEWGDYLIYRLYPNTKVFVDGRFDLYGAAFGEKYLDVMNVKYDWEQNLRRYAVDTILLPVDASLAGALKQSRDWHCVYDDGIAIVFRSATPLESYRFPAAANTGGGIPRGSNVTGSQHRDRRITQSAKGS